MVRIRLIEIIGIYRLPDFLRSFPGFSFFPIAVSLDSTNPSTRKEKYKQIGAVPIPSSMDGEGACSTDLGTEGPERKCISGRSLGMNSFPPRNVMIWVVAGLLACTPRLTASEPWVSHFTLGALFHPVQVPECLPTPACALNKTCDCSNAHVYIFAVNGIDTLCLGNFDGLCDYLRERAATPLRPASYLPILLAFAKSARRIRAAYCAIGSAALATSQKHCHPLNKDGTRIDLLVYLAGDYITNSPSTSSNVGNVLNIRGKGYLFLAEACSSAEQTSTARNCSLGTATCWPKPPGNCRTVDGGDTSPYLHTKIRHASEDRRRRGADCRSAHYAHCSQSGDQRRPNTGRRSAHDAYGSEGGDYRRPGPIPLPPNDACCS